MDENIDHQLQYIAEALPYLPADIIRMIFKIIFHSESGLE